MYHDCVFSYQSLQGKKVKNNVQLYFRLSKAKNLLDYNVEHNWRIDELAKQAAISEHHFIRKFQQAFGSSPHQYHVNRKLELAVRLLSTNTIPVGEVAYATGFSDIHSFSKAFKKKHGLSPTKYRDNSSRLTVKTS